MARFPARYTNREIPAGSLSEYFGGYVAEWAEAARSVDPSSLEALYELIRGASAAGRRIFVAGNGGSAAISDHLCCDWTKGTHSGAGRPIRTHSLVSNTSLFTALANDAGLDEVFSAQLEMYAEPGDVLVAISCSGESENVVAALRAAKRLGMKAAALTGFSGGRAGGLADVHVHVKIENYGIVEDVHQSVMHSLAQYAARAMAEAPREERLIDIRKRRAR